MIDLGLLLSVVVAIGAPSLLATRWRAEVGEKGPEFVDLVLGPLLVGVVVARLTWVLFDHPGTLGRPLDLLIIRSGMEFWAGAVATVIALAVAAHRAAIPPLVRLATLAPLSLVGVAGFEGTCVLRDGCFGPSSPVGLRPEGVASTMFPVGMAMAAAMVLAGWFVQRSLGRHTSVEVVAMTVLTLASIRAIGSFWLPHLGPGLTRPHLTSIAVAVLAGSSLVLARWSPARTEAAKV